MKTNGIRRQMLRFGLMALGGVALGLIKPLGAFAGTRNRQAFEAKTSSDAMKAIGVETTTVSTDITLKAPAIADSGAVVPITVSSTIPGTEYIAVIVEKNPFPLAAEFDLAGAVEPYVSTRIKMGQTSSVHAVVRAGGKTYTATKEIKVAAGGCGG